MDDPLSVARVHGEALMPEPQEVPVIDQEYEACGRDRISADMIEHDRDRAFGSGQAVPQAVIAGRRDTRAGG